MKRRSLAGPLLLILIGVVFLLKQVWPELAVVETLLRYWPFLLIFWGLARLAQILWLRSEGRPLPCPGVSGGEWALVILLTVIGSSAWGVQRWSHNFPGNIRIGGVELLGEAYDFQMDATQKCPKQARVVVENLRGTTRIVGVDSEEVKVTGRKMVRAMDKGEADRTNSGTPLEISEAGGQVTVRTNQERAPEGRRVSADIEVRVPKGCSVEARGRHGDFDISDLQGEVSITGETGGYRVQNIAGPVRVNARRMDMLRATDLKGDLEVRGGGKDLELENIAGQVTVNGAYSGESSFRNLAKPMRFESEVTQMRFERLPGQLDLSLSNLTGTNIVGPFKLVTKSKDVNLADVSNGVEISVERGDVELRQSKLPMSKTDVQVKSGDIELALPAGAKYSLSASTERGEMTNDLDEKLKEEQDGRGVKLTGVAGAGPEIKVLTRLGNVTVRKLGADEPATPPPPPTGGVKPPRPPRAPKPPERADNQ